VSDDILGETKDIETRDGQQQQLLVSYAQGRDTDRYLLKEGLDASALGFSCLNPSFKRSQIMSRSRKSRKARKSCGSADIIVYNDLQNPSGLPAPF
jgi:hypothetical protein